MTMTYTYAGPVAHSSGNGNLPVNRIVIHCTAGTDAGHASGTAKYFQSSAATGSAHYIVDPNVTLQCAYDSVVCWHAPPNAHSLGIEIECSLANDGKGHWDLASHIAMMGRAATLTAQKCVQYGIPAVKLSPADLVAGKHGICGHVDVTNAFHQSTHTDPGPYFPWVKFMAMVQAEIASINGTKPVTPPEEDDMPYTPEQLRAMMQAEIEEYMARFWTAPTGTGTAVRAQLDRIEKAVEK
jgi:N-acetyl-anhydromuramyl-L-alanine amidase AmpD